MLTYYCAVPENIHTPPNRRDWNFQRGGGGWGGGWEKNPFCGVGRDTFWICTL